MYVQNGTTPISGPDYQDLRTGLIILGVVLAFFVVSFIVTVLWYLRNRLISLDRKIQRMENEVNDLKKRTMALESTEDKVVMPIRAGSRVNDGYESTISSSVSTASYEQINVIVRGQQASIVGNPRVLSQVYSISQDYFDSNGASEGASGRVKSPTPTERFNIRSRRFQNEIPLGKIPEGIEEAARPDRPVSYFIPAHVDGQHAEAPYHGAKELFKQKSIDHTGGEIELSGIRLVVPPGSLDTPVKMSIGITWNREKFPKLADQQALLSPIVICEPQGIQFKIPVELSFPHCAVDIHSKWKATFYHSALRIDQEPEWKAMTLEDYVERKLEKHRVTIKLKHFTLYTLMGESQPGELAAKAIQLLAFAPPLKANETYKVRIYCVENYQREREKIIEGEKELYGKPVHQKVPLCVYGDKTGKGKNVRLENRSASMGWKLEGNQAEEFSLRLIWHGETPSRQFAFSSEEGVNTFLGEFAGFQVDNKEDPPTLLYIAQDVQTDTTAEQEANSPRLVQYRLRRKLAFLLDPPAEAKFNDWTMFAEQLEFGQVEIRWLYTQKSPTLWLLDEWEKRNESIPTLQQIMNDIERPDCAEEISNYYSSQLSTVSESCT